MDDLTKAYNKAKYELYKEEHKVSMKKWRQKQLSKEVGDNNKCCTRCYKIQPITEYGEYKGMVKIDGEYQEAMVPYKSCNKCRERDKQRQWNKCLISSDDDEEVKETKSMLAIKTIGIIQMY